MIFKTLNNEVLTDKIFIDALLKIAHDAGAAIMDVYHSDDFGIATKNDDSPVTKADLAANGVIEKGLAQLTPNITMVSEETYDKEHHSTAAAPYWLIDPLDGTKEFIKRKTDFTVNIALIYEGAPIFGVVYAPARSLTYWGGLGFDSASPIGAWKNDGDHRAPISVSPMGTKAKIVASASHLNEETQNFINQYKDAELVQAGSSIKICMIADGGADLYPRLAPTSEWDTGAADAVLRGAGGMLFQTDGTPLQYGKDDILNPYFIGAISSYQCP